MTKLVLKEAYRKVGRRTYSLVQCPSCSSTRDVRVDALKDQESTLCRSCVTTSDIFQYLLGIINLVLIFNAIRIAVELEL